MAERKSEKWEEDMAPVFPANDIICRNCRNRRNGVIGFKCAYCKAYPKGKPDEILFENADCDFYDKE